MDNKIIYKAQFQIDLGDAIPEVGGFVEKLNSHLATAGCDEKLKIESDIFSIDVTVDRELTPNERHKMKVLLESTIIKLFPQYAIRLTSFGRKSGKAQQSVA